LRDLIARLDDLRERGVKFRPFTEQIDTETPTGRAMWQMIGVLAKLERSLISEQTRAGVKAAVSEYINSGSTVSWFAVPVFFDLPRLENGILC
jgi:DNA invertase Pin-like site-specific DNA recombinase